MRRWLDMLASRQLARRIVLDAGMHGLAHLADPLCVVEAMAAAPVPPMFIAAGLDDPVAADSQRLDAALQRLHSPCAAHYYAGETHAFHVMFWRAQALLCWRDSFEFLQKQLPVGPS